MQAKEAESKEARYVDTLCRQLKEACYQQVSGMDKSLSRGTLCIHLKEACYQDLIYTSLHVSACACMPVSPQPLSHAGITYHFLSHLPSRRLEFSIFDDCSICLDCSIFVECSTLNHLHNRHVLSASHIPSVIDTYHLSLPTICTTHTMCHCTTHTMCHCPTLWIAAVFPKVALQLYSPPSPSTHIYKYLHVCLYTHIHVCKCVCVYMYVCMCTHTHTRTHAHTLNTHVHMYEMCTCIYMYTCTHVHTITHTSLPLIVLVQMDGDAAERSNMRASNMGGSKMEVVEAERIRIHTLAAGETLPQGAVVVTPSATLSSAQEHPRRQRSAHTRATHLEKAVKRGEMATLVRAKAQGGAATAPTSGSKGLVTVEQRLGVVNHDSRLTPVKQHHLKDAQQQKLLFARTSGTHLAFVWKLQVDRHTEARELIAIPM